jgi:hypothetical protein
MKFGRLLKFFTIILLSFLTIGCTNDFIEEQINIIEFSDSTVRSLSAEIIINEQFYEALPNFGIDFHDKENYIKFCLPELENKSLYDGTIDIKSIIRDQNINFIFKYSNFPSYKINIPILWTGFTEPYQSDNSWQFYYQSLDWLKYYTSQKTKSDPNPNLDFRIKHLIGGYILNDYASNALNQSLEFAWNDHAIARRTDRTREYLEDYINNNDSLNINILYPALKIAYSHYLKLVLPDHYPRLPHNHGLMMDMALYKAALYFNFLYKDETKNKSIERINWQIKNSISSKGVHLEHSPGYQNFYLKLLLDVVESFLNSDLEVPEYLINSVDNMFMAIPYLLQPNKTYPQFGDTPNSQIYNKDMLENYINLNITDADLAYLIEFFKNSTSSEEYFQKIKIFDGAGYAAFRSNWSTAEPEKDIMAHFSCNFFSWTHYHRSENTFELYGYGTEIIVDAGHHNFNRNDPYTSFSYQSYAHNVLLVNNQNYKPNEKYFGASKIDDHFINNEGLSWVKGNHPHYRHLNIEKVYRYFGMDDQSLFYLKDSLSSPNSKYTYQQLFTLRPEFENVEKLENDLILASSNNSNFPGLAIYPFISNFTLSIKNGINKEQIMGWYFERKNHKSPTNTIVLDYRDLGHNVELPVIMEVIPPSEVHDVRGKQDLYLEKYRSKKEYLSFSKQ